MMLTRSQGMEVAGEKRADDQRSSFAVRQEKKDLVINFTEW